MSNLNVFQKVLSLYKERYQDSTDEFKKGMETTLKLFLIGIKREDSYNLNVRIIELEKKEKEKEKIIRNQKEEINKLIKKTSKQIFISGAPLNEFMFYELPDVTKGEDIVIVVNMDKETFMMLWYIFIARYTWTKSDECKSKLISFINRYEAQGFKAYKDLKTARKEGVRV